MRIPRRSHGLAIRFSHLSAMVTCITPKLNNPTVLRIYTIQGKMVVLEIITSVLK